MATLSETLRERGYVYQQSSETLEEVTDGNKRTLYLGIDPSSDSLQVGQLQAFLILRRFLEDGHKIILLIGGGTGMIGDPGGKSVERPLLDVETVKNNGNAIAHQAKQLFGSADFTLVNNADWLATLNMIDFLRDVGKHFTVNTMLQREFVKERVENADQGISYTEFSYALLQAYDFLHLHQTYSCDLQVGGSDQWGNIISGVDYVRRKTGDVIYALTWPLLINKSTGKKFGKSEQGTVWLDPAKTSSFQFYQFWFNVDDDSLEEYFLKMTMLPQDEIRHIVDEHVQDPSARTGQKRIALEVTTLVHGRDEAANAAKASQILFSESPINTIDDATGGLLASVAPKFEITPGYGIEDVLVGSNLASSKREARQFLSEGAVTLNGNAVNIGHMFSKEDFNSSFGLLKRGKRNVCVLILK